MQTQSSDQTQVATFGAGCFWCVETMFQDIQGVSRVESGYSGGHLDNPTYRQVCDGNTGHAEVVNVYFDPNTVSFRTLVDVFFTVHDPTTLNRQGNDIGTQYRSAIFYHNDEQKQIAEEELEKARADWQNPIVTEITAFDRFFKAEDYHQNYYKDNPNQPYCAGVIAPKYKKFKEKFKSMLKEQVF